MRKSVVGQLTGTEESKENQTRWIFKDAMVEDLIEALEASKIESNPPSPSVFDRLQFKRGMFVRRRDRLRIRSFFSPLAVFLLAVLHLPLRATVCKYRESGVSREIFNFFIFCSNNLYSELFSKILLKGPEAL